MERQKIDDLIAEIDSGRPVSSAEVDRTIADAERTIY